MAGSNPVAPTKNKNGRTDPIGAGPRLENDGMVCIRASEGSNPSPSAKLNYGTDYKSRQLDKSW